MVIGITPSMAHWCSYPQGGNLSRLPLSSPRSCWGKQYRQLVSNGTRRTHAARCRVKGEPQNRAPSAVSGPDGAPADGDGTPDTMLRWPMTWTGCVRWAESGADDGTVTATDMTDGAPVMSQTCKDYRSHQHGHRRGRSTWRVYKRRRRVVWAVVIAVGGIVLAAAWVGFRLWQAHGTLSKLQSDAGAARSEAHDFLWSTVQHLGVIGPTLRAVRIIADSVDGLCWQTLPPLAAVAPGSNPTQLAPRGGVVDVSALQKAAPEILQATKAIHALQGTVDGINPIPKLSPDARPMRAIYEQRSDTTMDGGIASDLVAPPEALKGAGLVTLSNGWQLTVSIAVTDLVSEAGLTTDKARPRRDLFQEAPSSVLAVLACGQRIGLGEPSASRADGIPIQTGGYVPCTSAMPKSTLIHHRTNAGGQE